MNIAYLAHDLNDAAVHRRVSMLKTGGAALKVLGFRRLHLFPERDPADVPVIQLGATQSGKLVQRIGLVFQALLKPGSWRTAIAAADVFIARNLEMLLLAWLMRTLTRGRQTIVYECLDIHDMMLDSGVASRVARAAERWLLAKSRYVIVSSPAFRSEYFVKQQGRAAGFILLENKVVMPDDVSAARSRPSALPSPPWRIGWYGSLRCAKSLDQMLRLGEACGGQLAFDLWGLPALNQIPDFHRMVEASPHLTYHGAYFREDLERIYGGSHFSWTIDYFQQGGNSEWLLPNRLYEGGLYGTVPIAQRRGEIGAWLARNAAGAVFDDVVAELPSYIASLTAGSYETQRQATLAIPLEAITIDQTACETLVAAMADDAVAASLQPTEI